LTVNLLDTLRLGYSVSMQDALLRSAGDMFGDFPNVLANLLQMLPAPALHAQQIHRPVE
jgi:hypothetical protein